MAEEELSTTTMEEEHEKHALPPPPPNPSEDTGILRLSPNDPLDSSPTSQDIDIFALSSIGALKLLCAGVEWLVRMTGDIPPTPPNEKAEPVGWRNMRGIQAEKENIVKSTSQTNLAAMNLNLAIRPSNAPNTDTSPECDGISLRKTPRHNSETRNDRFSRPLEPYLVIGANAEPLNIQHSAITRKFYCKSPPAISLEDYLLRIHSFCPMSCAVYLATSYYIHKLAVEERAIPVTRRNCHRLLLAGLRVAMKALEDLSYPHSRLSRVGGVSPRELVVLEVSFCFLTGFELCVGPEELARHVGVLRDINLMGMGSVGWVPKLPARSALRGVGRGHVGVGGDIENVSTVVSNA